MNRKRLHSNSELIINKKHKYKSCAIILMGLPGSGKSYLSPKIINHINIILDNEYQYINLNPDNIIISLQHNLTHMNRILFLIISASILSACNNSSKELESEYSSESINE